jgi:predicted 3-demethylubiquinone-9 3-methyltransferase (glyoxalase superfamily)
VVDHQAEDAARFYIAIFKDSKILAISRYPEAGQAIHGKPAGSVMTVAFELNRRSYDSCQVKEGKTPCPRGSA